MLSSVHIISQQWWSTDRQSKQCVYYFILVTRFGFYGRRCCKNIIIKTQFCDGRYVLFTAIHISQCDVIGKEIAARLSADNVNANLSLSTPWRHTKKHLYTFKPYTHWIERWMGPSARLDDFGKRRMFSLAGIWNPVRLSRSLLAIPTTTYLATTRSETWQCGSCPRALSINHALHKPNNTPSCQSRT
jgi:hypothetical protein